MPEDSTNGTDQAKSQPTKKLPTARIAFDKQTTLLRGWVAASGSARKAAGNKEVAEIVQMAASTVSLANPFFVETGLLEKSNGGFVPSDPVRSFSRYYEYMPETAGHKLAELLAQSWFGKAVLPKLSVRALEKKEAVAALADACHAGPQHKSRLELLLDYLRFGGLVVLDGEQVKPAARPSSVEAEPDKTAEKPKAKTSSAMATGFVQPTEGQVQFHVDVKVDMTEFAGWSADRITAFFGGIAQVLAAKGALEKKASKD